MFECKQPIICIYTFGLQDQYIKNTITFGTINVSALPIITLQISVAQLFVAHGVIQMGQHGPNVSEDVLDITKCL